MERIYYRIWCYLFKNLFRATHPLTKGVFNTHSALTVETSRLHTFLAILATW